MTRPKYPSPADTDAVDVLIVMTQAVADGIAQDSPNGAVTVAEADRVMAATKDRVLGNRTGNSPITWSDLRYYLVGVLRAIADRLDGNVVDDAGPAGL